MRDGIDRRQFLKAGAVLGGGILGGGIFDLVDAMGSGRQDAACGCFDNSLPPVLRIRSGDTVVIETGAHRLDGMVLGAETEDWIGRYKDAMARRPDTRFYPDPAAGVEEQGKHPGHAHLAGPIHVEGAEPGDILRIEILEIIPALYGFHIRPGPSTVKGRVQWYRTNLERFEFGFRDEVRIPLRPF
ncbi:MAG: putative acetamidase/formamidase, partial [Deltaproteobacteria bacterium]|nr:putative acetamidase/formamidase [Deltaproteobacteria bacterium]